MRVSGSGEGPTLPPEGPSGTGRTFYNRVIKHLATLEEGLRGLQNREPVTGAPFNQDQLSRGSVAHIKNEPFEDILRDAESIEDLLFLKNQLEIYKNEFIKSFPCNQEGDKEYEKIKEFFEDSGSKVIEKIGAKEEQAESSSTRLPAEISTIPSNPNQADIYQRLNKTIFVKGILALQIPLDPLLKNVLPKGPVCSSYRNQPMKAALQFTIRSEKSALPPPGALEKCFNIEVKEKETPATLLSGRTGGVTATSTASGSDPKVLSEITIYPKPPVAGSDLGSTQSDTTHEGSDLNKRVILTREKSEGQPPEKPTTGKPKEEPQQPIKTERVPLNLERQEPPKNNLNPLLPLPGPVVSQSPAATDLEKSEKPPEKRELKNSELQKIIKVINELEELLGSEMATLTEAEDISRRRKQLKTNLDNLQLSTHNFIKQQLTANDPCQAQQRIGELLREIQDLQASLEKKPLHKDEVNEALVWLRDLVESLKGAETEAAAKCKQWKNRKFQVLNLY